MLREGIPRIWGVLLLIAAGAALLGGCGVEAAEDSDALVTAQSSGGGSGVPLPVRIATRQHLGINPGEGAEITEISGTEQDVLGDGTAMWNVQVEYRMCSQCNRQAGSFLVPVDGELKTDAATLDQAIEDARGRVDDLDEAMDQAQDMMDQAESMMDNF